MPSQRYRRAVSSKGFTLVEIIIAIGLGALIASGILHIYNGSRQTSTLSNSLTDIQTNARFAMELLTPDIRLAGFQGCADANQIFLNSSNGHILADLSPTEDLFRDSLRGFETTDEQWATDSFLANTFAGNNATPGSDVLTVMHASPDAVALNAAMITDRDAISLANNPMAFSSGDLLLIASCANAHLFRASAVDNNDLATHIFHDTSHNSSAGLGATYDERAALHRFEVNTYFIAPDNSGTPTLFRQDSNGDVEALIQGAENMQVLYGQRNSSGLRYVSADDPSLVMSEVVSIQLALLIRSQQPVLPTAGPTSIAALNETIAIDQASDRRLRRVVTTTIQIRNRRG